MEDLAEVLKRQYLGLYKKKNDIFGTVQQRVDKMNQNRKTNRRQEIFEKRNIPVDMSPVVTPGVKRQKPQQKKPPQVENSQPVVNKRLEMLRKWKEDKERRFEAQKKNSKPIFKVCHIPIKMGLPNLENVNKEIKGKAFKPTFAPENHKFKPPANVQPILMNKVSKTTNTQEKQKTEVSFSRHGMMTRSQSLTSSKGKNPNGTKKEPKMKSTKRDQPKDTKRDQPKDTKTKSKTNVDPLMSPDFPLKNENASDTEKTPEKINPPAYVSPFVTMSRGKDSARKEYEARRSNQSFSAKKGALDCTSPKAGAVYFRRLLSTQIIRLQEVCDQWNKYKNEENPPEEAVSMIDVAVGQTNLLLTKKFMQFKGLIDQSEKEQGQTMVKCEDLHGFWDMMYIQVENLDKRFEHLTSLKANNWQEILPIITKPAAQKRGRPTKSAKASAGLKAAIEAARRKKENDEKETPQRRRSSHRLEVVRSESKSHSPGLMIMKVGQYAKTVETPGKSILKSETRQSVKSQTKTVLFKDEVEETGDLENDFNKSNVQTPVKTPTRRSIRVEKNKLFNK